jgi:hypothetical protein
LSHTQARRWGCPRCALRQGGGGERRRILELDTGARGERRIPDARGTAPGSSRRRRHRRELIRSRLYERPTLSTDEALAVQVFKTHLDRLANGVRGMVFRMPLAVVLADHSIVQPNLAYLSKSRRSAVALLRPGGR